MITMSLRSHLDHMDLKNWVFSLFDVGRPLHTYGFRNRRATPIIASDTKEWTPDVIAWSDKMALIIECKTGEPDEEDIAQAKSYADIPESAITSLTGTPNLSRKVILLYFKDRLYSNPKLLEALLAKSSLEKDLVIWACEKGYNIALVDGSHAEDELDSLLRGNLGLTHFPAQAIEIQPDSPTVLVERLLLTRLWERAFKYKDTRFTIGTAKEILENHNYADKKNRERRLNDAIRSAEKHGLCSTEQTGAIWKLNFIADKPSSVTNYLEKLNEIIKYPELQNFISES